MNSNSNEPPVHSDLDPTVQIAERSDASLPPTVDEPLNPPSNKRSVPLVPIVIAIGVVLVILTGQTLLRRAAAETNHVALASSPKEVTVVQATAATFRPTRRYVGSIDPWISAHVGPQFVSAYVSTVLVRPGAPVHRGDVLATLDCREASAVNQSVALQARAIEASQVALSRQANRVSGLLGGGYVAQNDVDQREAESANAQARLLATRAQLQGTNLAVSDCILRAPFDGEISERGIDPGAFIRPGTPVVTEVDRTVVRVTAEVPETDFDVVAPNTPVRIHVVATDAHLDATVTRRSPAADPSTRTVHIELDVPDPDRRLPVNTTAELLVDVGQGVPAIQIPLIGADIRGARANVFEINANHVAHRQTLQVLGESGGDLFVEPTIPAGTEVVTEGRSMLSEGDRVHEQLAAATPPTTAPTLPPSTVPPQQTPAAPQPARRE